MEKQIEAFLDAMAYVRGLAPLTCASYRTDLLELVAFLQKRSCSDWRDVTSTDLIEHLADLQARGYAEASLLRHAATLRTFFGWLLEENRIPFSPTDALVAGKLPKRLPHTLDEKTLNGLIEAVDGETPADLRDRLMLELLYGCGLRCSELLGLNLHDVDLSTRQIRVHGKGRKERVVPFGPPAEAALKRYLKARTTFAMTYKKGALAAELLAPTAPLILTPTGKRLRRPFVAQVVHARIHAFLPESTHATPHTLRHAFATHLLNHGAPLMDIRDLLGHASVATTQIYTHVSDNHLKDVFRQCFPRQ